MKVYEQQIYNAMGGKSKYLHKKGKENVQTTKLQNFLDEFIRRNSSAKININDYKRSKRRGYLG